ncbi:MAG: DUF2934 domain-containing protein [Methylobacter tundripaludum]|nr:DUF2934 domain-containing protein [Methylobacter tundripaludum]
MTDKKSQQNNHNNDIDPDKFSEMVAERAYLKAEKRGFVAGHELEDWLEAEQEVSNQCHNGSQEV